MSVPILRQIGSALRNLNPKDVREMADRNLAVGVLAADEQVAGEIFSFLIPDDCSEAQARIAGKQIVRVGDESDFARCDLGLAEAGVPHPAHFYGFDALRPEATRKLVLDEREDDWIPLARAFPGFRDEVIERIIWKVSKENALFTVATALPNIVPSPILVPWAAGEFASDTAFLTMNQVRMAFLIAAASDSDVGYGEQKGQIGSIVAAAFGWRTLARELVGKIPAGGGLVSKGLVSLAGTYVIGKGLETFFRLGRRMTRDERRHFYSEAFRRGKSAVRDIVSRTEAAQQQVPAAD